PQSGPRVADRCVRGRPRAAGLTPVQRVAMSTGRGVVAIGWSLSSGAAYSLASKVLHAKPLTRVETQRPQVALVLRVPQASVGQVRGALSARRGHASFAVTGPVSRMELTALSAAGDDGCPVTTRR